MKVLMSKLVLGAAFAALLATTASAQVVVQESKAPPGGPRWYRFGGSTGGVPGAAAPAAPGLDIHKTIGQAYGDAVAKLPDWNGVWGVKDELAVGVFDPATADGVHDDKEGADFGVVAGGREHPPYTPEYEKIYSDRIQKTLEGYNDDYVSFCRPQGFPLWYANPGQWDFIVTPKVIWWVMGEQGNIRRIYMDGRTFLDPDVGYPQDQGFSLGHWEGDTLVVHTTNLLPGYYDQTDPPYSDKTEVTERIRLVTPTRLEDRMTIVDPVMLIRPWEVTRYFEKRPGTPFQTFADGKCEPQDMSQGYQAPLLPQEREAAARKAAAKQKN
jgi:hypothetical protein